jgi:hypothetical protein
MIRVVILIVASLAYSIVAAIVAQASGGQNVWVLALTACGLCLVPAVFSYGLTVFLASRSPEEQLISVLVGTGLRLVTPFLVGLLLQDVSESFRQPSKSALWIWVLVHYPVTLILEVVLLASRFGLSNPLSSTTQPAR